jgi:hypothetical protein
MIGHIVQPFLSDYFMRKLVSILFCSLKNFKLAFKLRKKIPRSCPLPEPFNKILLCDACNKTQQLFRTDYKVEITLLRYITSEKETKNLGRVFIRPFLIPTLIKLYVSSMMLQKHEKTENTLHGKVSFYIMTPT